MHRLLAYLLLTLALVFQGAIAVGASVMPESAPMEHCAGHDMSDKDCKCCPDGAMMSIGCAVQCSVAQQAPVSVIVPIRIETSTQHNPPAQLMLRNPFYLPLIPPPIA
ncbi:hypothetical protein [Steroidobacter cummioxidans]|uniref:hypothetical protein n=1 Tax=Steroidobacter cummioxidans TaxID=1803913 RepID=UPI000E31E945|nr:hypothetical protein [Steroidobacter cummioxidans]